LKYYTKLPVNYKEKRATKQVSGVHSISPGGALHEQCNFHSEKVSPSTTVGKKGWGGRRVSRQWGGEGGGKEKQRRFRTQMSHVPLGGAEGAVRLPTRWQGGGMVVPKPPTAGRQTKPAVECKKKESHASMDSTPAKRDVNI